MDASRNYQRAVTPTIGDTTIANGAGGGLNGITNGNNGVIRGKTLNYQGPSLSNSQSHVKNLKLGNNTDSGASTGGNSGPVNIANNKAWLSAGVINGGAIGVGQPPIVQKSTGVFRQDNSLPTMHNVHPASQTGRTVTKGSIPYGSGMPAYDNAAGRLPSSGVGYSNDSQSNSSTPALPRYDLIPLTDELPGDGIIFTRLKNQPDSLVVFRTPEERARNPERLNLDRRQLDVCPILEQEQRLRLLNFQNNNIKAIQNIDNLPNLIFLDMYNNKLTTLDGPLSNVKGLRVLMAGKNKLTSITNLGTLKKLDVLDLHSNEIKIIDGLSGLHELRVLNLAGNKISVVQNLSSLHSLTELNLRRNSIEKIVDLDKIPALQRVFLSHNNITSFNSIACLYNVKMLIELSMDGNDLSESNPVRYRQRIIAGMPNLRHLDLKRIIDEEKAAAIEACVGLTPLDPIEAGLQTGGTTEVDSVTTTLKRVISSNDIITPPETAAVKTPTSTSISLAALARSGKISAANDLIDLEIIGNNEKALIIVGDRWDWIPNRRLFSNVVEISLCHIKKDAIISKVIPSLPQLTTAKTLRMISNGLEFIRDILQLSELWVPYLEHIIIMDNPISQIGNIYEDFLIVKIPNIQTINGDAITQQRKLHALKKLSPILYAVKASKEIPFANFKNRPVPSKKGEAVNSKNAPIKGTKSNWDDLNASELLLEITQETMRRRGAQEQFNHAFEFSMKQVVNRTISTLMQNDYK